jgi:hypothetical protein
LQHPALDRSVSVEPQQTLSCVADGRKRLIAWTIDIKWSSNHPAEDRKNDQAVVAASASALNDQWTDAVADVTSHCAKSGVLVLSPFADNVARHA